MLTISDIFHIAPRLLFYVNVQSVTEILRKTCRHENYIEMCNILISASQPFVPRVSLFSADIVGAANCANIYNSFPLSTNSSSSTPVAVPDRVYVCPTLSDKIINFHYDMPEIFNFLGGMKFLRAARVQLAFFLKPVPEITTPEAIKG